MMCRELSQLSELAHLNGKKETQVLILVTTKSLLSHLMIESEGKEKKRKRLLCVWHFVRF